MEARSLRSYGQRVTVKVPLLVAVPPGVVTEMEPLLALLGTHAVICVSESTVKFALAPLNFTTVAPLRFVPVTVTPTPDAPATGEKPEIVGDEITLKSTAVLVLPPGVVTEIGPVVAPGGTVAAI
jgi:hypothetical protein